MLILLIYHSQFNVEYSWQFAPSVQEYFVFARELTSLFGHPITAEPALWEQPETNTIRYKLYLIELARG